MKRKMLSILLVLTLCLGITPVTANAKQSKATAIKTPVEAVSEMTWGVNLADLYIADIGRPQGSTTGYYDTVPFAFAMWFWNEEFTMSESREANGNVMTVSFPFPKFNKNEKVEEWIGGLFAVGILTRMKNQKFKISLSDSKIVKKNGKSTPLNFLNGTYKITASDGPDDNGYWCYMFDIDKSKLPKPGASLNDAKFETKITVIDAPFASGKAKADYFFEFERVKMNQKVLTDQFLEQGVNVIRLPVTWTPFVNNETFEIDKSWLKAVKSEVDYIISKDAYCILNMHNDYLQRSYVGDHWEILWMNDEYKDYVDRRFTAVWTQIAEYFKDYSQKLIFEPFNEPTMEWYEGCTDYMAYMDKQANRVNELNALFVNTVRETGGKNKTRLLCLAVAEYNQYHQLSNMVLPDDDYLIAQVHTYSAMEADPNMGDTAANFDYKAETDALFKAIRVFTEQTGTPVIIGEVGVSHREPDTVLLPRVKYFFKQAAEHGVPCLWWEDFFYAEDNSQFWLYNKEKQEWGRPKILKAIKDAIKNAVSMQ